MRLTRRRVVGGGALLIAGPAYGQTVVDAAPAATDVAAWTAYEARLRARLADGRFDAQGADAALATTNSLRLAAGAPPLTWHAELAETARAHAADLAARRYVEHLSPEGFDPSHRFWLLARTTIGSPSENIAYHRGEGPPAPAGRMVERWRQSPGHWQNVLRASHTHAGYGVVRGPDRVWVVGLFAQPLATLPEPLPFRAREPEIARAIRATPSALSPRLTVPQGSRPARLAGATPVMQLTAVRRIGGVADIIGGPIFISPDPSGLG